MRKYTAFLSILLMVLVAFCWPAATFAQTPAPAQSAETIRTALVSAQISLASDPTAAQKALATAQATYLSDLAAPLRTADAQTAARVMAGLADAQQALAHKAAPAFAIARARSGPPFCPAVTPL